VKTVLLEPGDEDLLIEATRLLNDVELAPEKAAVLLRDETYVVVVALDAGKVAGRAYGNVLHRHAGSDLLLYEIDTLPQHQRKGAALAMLECLKQLVREKDYGEMWVLTEGDNVAARALYRKAGGGEEGSPAFMYVFPRQ
jgi:ribosomal protein S18 acetylase RimI-like enzyme